MEAEMTRRVDALASAGLFCRRIDGREFTARIVGSALKGL